MIYVVNVIREGMAVNTWATTDEQAAHQHAAQCVEDYVKTDHLKNGLPLPSQIVLTKVEGNRNEIMFAWLPEDLED